MTVGLTCSLFTRYLTFRQGRFRSESVHLRAKGSPAPGVRAYVEQDGRLAAEDAHSQ